MSTRTLKLKYAKTQTFEVAVVSTMSSGKSTFINALIGEELLPARNQACTARTLAVLDNDLAESVTGHILFDNGNYERIEDCTASEIASCLKKGNNDVADIIVECSIPGVRNIQRALLVTDTPGTNNSTDKTHESVTKAYLKALSSGLIIYIMNATQIGTDDEFALLTEIKETLEHNPKLDILFVLNKMDEVDTEKEPLSQVVDNCNTYLTKIGFTKSTLLPTSALSTLLFRKALSGSVMSKKEVSDFTRLIEYFSSPALWLPMYAVFPNSGEHSPACKVGKQTYSRGELLFALENTGMPAIERAIETSMMQQLIKKAPGISNPATIKKETEKAMAKPARKPGRHTKAIQQIIPKTDKPSSTKKRERKK